MLLLWIVFVSYASFLSVVLSCMFLADLWSPAGIGLNSWLLYVLCYIAFCHFPKMYPGPYQNKGWGWRLVASLCPPVAFNYLSKAVLLLWIVFVSYASFLSAVLSYLFLVALWSPAGIGLSSWLLCVLCFLVFVTFPKLIMYPGPHEN